MKKAINAAMYMPLIGIAAPYLYIGICMLIIKSINLFPFDPKSFEINYLYELALYSSMIGIFLIGLLVIVILFNILVHKVSIKEIKGNYHTVLGFPSNKFYPILKSLGVKIL